MHRFVIRVRYGDTEQMGFAYYGNYLRWFEIGRAEMPVLEAHCRYLSPARYDDEVVIETGVRELRRASVRFGYSIRRGGGRGALGPRRDRALLHGPGGAPR